MEYWKRFAVEVGLVGQAESAAEKSTGVSAFAETAREFFYGGRRRAATAGVAALAILMGYGVVFGHNGLTAFAHKRSEARELSIQTNQLQEENARLREHVDRLQSDPGAIEHQAREELHYTRSGEVIYTLPAMPASKEPVAPPAN